MLSLEIDSFQELNGAKSQLSGSDLAVLGLNWEYIDFRMKILIEHSWGITFLLNPIERQIPIYWLPFDIILFSLKYIFNFRQMLIEAHKFC